MQTVWHGLITPPYSKRFSIDYTDKNITLKKGEELGRFNMGSTVILLSNTDDLVQPDDLAIKMGESFHNT